MNLRRAIGPALAILLLIGVGLGITRSIREKKQADIAAGRAAVRITVKVLTGSEKEKFLTDPELAKVLDDEGIAITVQKAGSREIASRPDLKTFDVAYPAGAPAAVKIAQTTGSKRTFTSLYTPMAVASWKSLIPVLEASGLVSHKEGVVLHRRYGQTGGHDAKGHALEGSARQHGVCGGQVGSDQFHRCSQIEFRRDVSGAGRVSRQREQRRRQRGGRGQSGRQHGGACSRGKAFRNRVPRGHSRTIRPWASAKRRW